MAAWSPAPPPSSRLSPPTVTTAVAVAVIVTAAVAVIVTVAVAVIVPECSLAHVSWLGGAMLCPPAVTHLTSHSE